MTREPIPFHFGRNPPFQFSFVYFLFLRNTSYRLRSNFFLIFLSLVIYKDMQKQVESVEMSLDIPRNLKYKVFESDIVVQKLSKDQKELFKKIGVVVPNTV